MLVMKNESNFHWLLVNPYHIQGAFITLNIVKIFLM